MIKITYRKYNFKVKKVDEIQYIFDVIRKKYVILTPEEWVRQNFVHHLISDLKYNKNRISIEKEFVVNKRKKRFDILVYDKDMQVFMLIECKSPNITIDDKTSKQIFNYNIHFKAKYLVLTNGKHTFCLNQNLQWDTEMPKYP